MTLQKVFLTITISLWLSSCAVIYEQDIQQGNIITDNMLNNLELGMSKTRVRYYLGTPLIEDPFHNNRWDYYYGLQEGGNKRRKQAVVTLLFDESESLVNIIDQSAVKMINTSPAKLPADGRLNPVIIHGSKKNQTLWEKVKSSVL